MLPALIVDAARIEKLQNRLESGLEKRGELFEGNYKTRGTSEPDHAAYYFPAHNIYWKSGDSSDVNRFWNSFGLGKPTKLKDAFQLCIPKDGVDQRVQGGFLTLGEEVFLLHRVSLRGGRKDGHHDLCEMVPNLVEPFDDNGRDGKGVLFPFVNAEGNFDKNLFSEIARAVRVAAHELGRR